MAHLNNINNVAPADSLKAGADTLNTWRARLDELHQTLGLGSLTAAEVTQLQAIGTVTISAAQWGYLGACVAGGGQLLAALTEAESTQLEAIGTTTISAAQWVYLGNMDQDVITTSSVTFADLIVTGGDFQVTAAGAITAVSYGGITEANLVDKSASETISGAWTFSHATTPILTDIIAERTSATGVTVDGVLLKDGEVDGCHLTEVATGFTIEGGTSTSKTLTMDDTLSLSTVYRTGGTDVPLTDGGTGSSTAADARTALGLAIGTDVQAYDAELVALAGLTSAADKLPYFTGSGTAAVTTVTSFARSILDDANEATFKATVNLEIGTDVLAQQTIGIADNNLMEVDDTDAASTDYARFTATGLQGRDATEVKTDLGLVIGTNVQAYDAQLADIAALAVTDGNFIVGNGANWVAESGTTALASLGLVAELDNLTSGEVGQLEAIGATTISATQWGYLGALDQGLTTTSAVTFNGITMGGTLNMNDQWITNVNTLVAKSGNHNQFKLADNGGTYMYRIIDSDNVGVFEVDSNGGVNFTGLSYVANGPSATGYVIMKVGGTQYKFLLATV